ncbi:cyclin-dependent protein kinase inhibitor SMR1-like [Salvia miltiorrhiza]|uniref:cyclin-dependent protein kinase inhibitor SMR1-like n=1 Tax=Salvia miltiorrhiza TaxID=226208 RepID=UPI0025ACBE29|nr:cyclin-dependent protein kinase inhibitor SMR1-like [Salvia miltiorrhiza]
MSADLEIRLPIIDAAPTSQDSDKIDSIDGDSESCISEEEECLTPKSTEHMIPAALSPPPAPKKPLRRRGSSCKRKLYELDFFEAVAEDKIDAFFRKAEENIGGAVAAAAKRRCVV